MTQGANRKKKYTYVWVSTIILVFGIFAVYEMTKKVRGGSIVENDRMSSGTVQNGLVYIPSEGTMRSVPEFSFLNQDSVLVSNKDYLGKVYVVEFFFTTCPTICPIMTQNLLELQETFEGEEDFGIASFTINPRYDTPATLKQYAEKHGVVNPHWNFLTGEQEEIYRLAREGFYILAQEQQDAPGGFEHSGMFALIDKKGYIRSREDQFGNPLIYYRGTITQEQAVNDHGETQQITILKEDIKKLLAE